MKRLTKLANKYDTDKGTEYDYKHGYTEFYEPFFKKYEHPKILELGVGGGGSEKMLNQFYDGDCEIYCVDIMDLGYLFKDYENIHFTCLDLGNEGSVLAFIDSLENVKFDIIIDDASHLPEHQYVSLINFRKCLTDSGIFVMEDLHTSYDGSFSSFFNETPLMFLSGLKYNRFFFNEEEYNELINDLGDIIIYNRYNPSKKMEPWNNRSVTAIITFKNDSKNNKLF